MRTVLLSTALCASLLLSACSREKAVPEVKPPQTKEQAVEAFKLSHQAEIADMSKKLQPSFVYATVFDRNSIALSRAACTSYEGYLSNVAENNAEIFRHNKRHPNYQVEYHPFAITTQFIALCEPLKKIDAPK